VDAVNFVDPDIARGIVTRQLALDDQTLSPDQVSRKFRELLWKLPRAMTSFQLGGRRQQSPVNVVSHQPQETARPDSTRLSDSAQAPTASKR
jgi:hypothetical protein